MREGILAKQRAFRLSACALTLVLGLCLNVLFSRNIQPSINLRTAKENSVVVKNESAQNALTHYIATRFRLPVHVAQAITKQAFLAANTNKVKPTLILAIVAVESSYQPDAVNVVSGARGLMQILPKWHQRAVRRVGGVEALLQIRPNIEVGTEILAQYLRWGQGRLTAALGHYWGSVHCKVYVYRVKRQLRHLNLVVERAKEIQSHPFRVVQSST